MLVTPICFMLESGVATVPRVIERILALCSYVNPRAATSPAFVERTSENLPRRNKKKKKPPMQRGEDSTARVFVPGSISARVLLLYGYFVRNQKALQLGSAIGAAGPEERVRTLAAPAGRLRLKDGTALSVE